LFATGKRKPEDVVEVIVIEGAAGSATKAKPNLKRKTSTRSTRSTGLECLDGAGCGCGIGASTADWGKVEPEEVGTGFGAGNCHVDGPDPTDLDSNVIGIGDDHAGLSRGAPVDW
jgi:hypothetical protein